MPGDEAAFHKTVESEELARAASKRYEDVPAEYATVTKRVEETGERPGNRSAGGDQTIKVRRLVKAPEPVKVAVAPENATVNSR